MTHCHGRHGLCRDDGYDHHYYHHPHPFYNWREGCDRPRTTLDVPRGWQGHDCYYYRTPWDNAEAARAPPPRQEEPQMSPDVRRLEELVEQQAAQIAALEQKLEQAEKKEPAK
mmetsp:Transcript_14509/g.27596  ORF Transcript_14509/g.27596 Transcript_14509/m.27596 type:complete len:113 (+) Transcript_14509:80-418(+)